MILGELITSVEMSIVLIALIFGVVTIKSVFGDDRDDKR